VRSIVAAGMLATLLAGCGGMTMPSSSPYAANAAIARLAGGSKPGFAIRGKLYAITQQQVYPGIAGGLQAYTGSKPRLLGSVDGPTSDITSPSAVATDRRGEVFVGNGFGDNSCQTCAITEYEKNRYGDVAPMATVRDNVGWTYGLAIDGRNNVYVAGQRPQSSDGRNGVFAFKGGKYSLSRQLDMDHEGTGIALDSKKRIYLATINNGYQEKGALEVFAAGTHGSSSPIGTITGPHTGMSVPHGVAIDSAGDIYVAQFAANSVTVYSANTKNGNATPIRTVVGSATQLQQPASLSFDKAGNLYVCDGGSPYDILVFAPNAEGDAAPVAVLQSPPLQYAPYRATTFPQSSPGPP
jgi:hypothetical protein